MSRTVRAVFFAIFGFVGVPVCVGCDDPAAGPVGGLVLVIRSIPALADTRFSDVDRIEMVFNVYRLLTER